tara:strand:+ start:770 stop:1141 length:372 start_codon:yes stop_codon:yes gene_type:complete
MEFFRIIKIKTTEKKIQSQLTLASLDQISSKIFNLNTPTQIEANIGGIWGEFTLSRYEIKGGIRFSLLECPNALCWTITTAYATNPEYMNIYLTINRQEHNKEFIDEISGFLDDMTVKIKHFF